MEFFLGTGEVHWLWDKKGTFDGIPLFISAARLRGKMLKPKKATTDWCLDSGGFTALDKDGEWSHSVEQYAEEVCRWYQDVGRMRWAASMDWMCEPRIQEKTDAKDPIDASVESMEQLALDFIQDTVIPYGDAIVWAQRERSRMIVQEHQRRTLVNYLRLVELAPHIPWVPTLQGWGDDEHDVESNQWAYSEHADMYYAAGVELHKLPTVGLGSVCKRQGAVISEEIIKALYLSYDLKNLHGFGVKQQGLVRSAHMLKSADSMAWSRIARKDRDNIKVCDRKHQNCTSCDIWARQWREQLLEKVNSSQVIDVSPDAPKVELTHPPEEEPAPEQDTTKPQHARLSKRFRLL